MTDMGANPLIEYALRHPDLLTVDCGCEDGCERCIAPARYDPELGYSYRSTFFPGFERTRRLKTLAELLADIAERGWAHVQEFHLMPDGRFKLRAVCLHPMDPQWSLPADTREAAAAGLLVELDGTGPGGVAR